MNKTMAFFLAMLFLVMGGTTVWISWRAYNRQLHAGDDSRSLAGTSIDTFSLTERSGKTFYSDDLKGTVWVNSFFFATCPQSCIKQNQIVKELCDEYGPRGVKFVSITCDPRNDTVERLFEYASQLHADPAHWLFLTGELDYILQIGRNAFKIAVAEQSHSNRLMLVDKWGNVRGHYDWAEPSQLRKLRKRLDEALAETEEPVADSAE